MGRWEKERPACPLPMLEILVLLAQMTSPLSCRELARQAVAVSVLKEIPISGPSSVIGTVQLLSAELKQGHGRSHT